MGIRLMPLTVLKLNDTGSFHKYGNLLSEASLSLYPYAAVTVLQAVISLKTMENVSNPFYTDAGLEAAKDIAATITFAANLPYVKSDKILLVGQSAGGFASLAAASVNPPGVIGVVNFAGGRGGRPDTNPGEPCGPTRMATTIETYAKTIKVPVLWHYAENDKYFGSTYPRNGLLLFRKPVQRQTRDTAAVWKRRPFSL